MLNKSSPPPAKQDAAPVDAMILIQIPPVPAPAPTHVRPGDYLSIRKQSATPSAGSGASPQAKTSAPILVNPQEQEMQVDAAAPPPLRLDSETIRKAMQQDGREGSAMGFANRNAQGPVRPGSDAAFAAAISAAGHRPCERGEFVGSGRGLLSAPFLAAAWLRGECAR
ncbi:hypothetical protein N0K08_15420 [Acidovorax sp. Be4]|uniref:Uncharacterized protein n=1 Tax=Acidovorax bellezanensis TaxID=2976702 RepID=A0ABT2PNI1_9BURK|nr:hypothetical protein [Acidovorax sp. Be4]MCT9812035.1 hypothetical protein [Acidovorax sp. Be4]